MLRRLITLSFGGRQWRSLSGVSGVSSVRSLSGVSDSGGDMATQPIVFSGPSGSGKSTLVKKLMTDFSDCFAFSISHTTRKARLGEEHAREYYFVDREAMETAIAKDEFIETAEFSGNLYGTSKKAVGDVSATGRICILDIDMQGVKSVKKTNLKPLYIFVRPPSMTILEERLVGRGTETAESVRCRLAVAQEELDYGSQKGMYDHVIVNDDLDIAYAKLKGILCQIIDESKGH